MTTTHEKPTPAPVEVRQADRMLVEAIINDYHTTRLDSDYVSHILSKPRTQTALARHRIAHTAPAGEVELVEAVKASIEGWNNVVEFGLLPPQHHDTARALSERLHTALAKHTRTQGEG